MKSNWLVLPGLIGLSLIIWLLNQNLSERRCINSSLVNNLITYQISPSKYDKASQAIMAPMKATQLPNCEFRINRAAGQDLSSIQQRLRGQIERLELLFYNYHGLAPVKRLDLIIREDLGSFFRATPRQIEISTGALREFDMVDKTLLRTALENRFVTTNDFYLDVFSDFLYSVLRSELSVGQLKNTYGIPIHPNVKMSLENYCQSAMVAIVHLEYCRNHNNVLNELDSSNFDEEASWGQTALMVSLVWNYYSELDLNEKRMMIESLANKMNFFDWEISVSRPKSISAQQPWLLQEAEKIKTILNLNEVVWKKTLEERVVKAKPLKFKNLVSFNRSIDLRRLSPGHSRNTAFLLKNNRLGFVGLGETMASVDSISAHRIVQVSCAKASLKNPLLNLRVADRLIYIQECDEALGMQMVKSTMDDKLEQFLLNNKKVKYTEFHIPSVHLALAVNPTKSKNFAAIFSWESVKWDSQTNSFRPLAPYEGVVRFR